MWTKGNKKPPVQKVQTVAEPHSPSLYGESISASFTTPLGCTQSRRNFGYKLPTEAQSIYNNSGGLSMQKKKNPTRNRENRNSATVGFRFDYKLTVTLF